MLRVLTAAPLSFKIGALPALFVLATLVAAWHTRAALERQEQDLGLADISGRQRMLNQCYLEDVLLSAQGFEADPEATLGMLLSSQDVLLEGGRYATSRGESVELERAPAGELRDQLVAGRAQIEELGHLGAAALRADDEAFPARLAALRTASDEFFVTAQATVDRYQAHAHDRGDALARMLLLLAAGSILVGSIAGLVVARNVRDLLYTATETVDAIAEGDLERRLETHSSREVAALGNSVNGFLDRITRSLQGIHGGTNEIDRGAAVISRTSDQLSRSASDQAASLEQISAVITQVSHSAGRNSQNSTEASDLSSRAEAAAEEGTERMVQLSGAMDDILQSSSEISKIIRVIDDIAFQTNLLALNAAVEAARAGAAGQGFAVVAEEVRSLSMRSAEAARSTAELIERANQRADNGVAISAEVALSLGEIVDRTKAVSTLLNDIAAASVDQSEALDQISDGMIQLNSVTSGNTATAEELSASAMETTTQVATLREQIDFLRGHSPRATHASHASRPPGWAHPPASPPPALPTDAHSLDDLATIEELESF